MISHTLIIGNSEKQNGLGFIAAPIKPIALCLSASQSTI